MILESDIEPFLEGMICSAYWNCETDHEDFRHIINAIDLGGGQACDVVGVLRELFKAGYVIRKMKK